MPARGDALDCPDDSLASLSQLNTLMSFGWSNPTSPETTLILQNDVPVDKQLITSLPVMPGIRYHVKQLPTAGPVSSVMKSKAKSENTVDESLQQVLVLHAYRCCISHHDSNIGINTSVGKQDLFSRMFACTIRNLLKVCNFR